MIYTHIFVVVVVVVDLRSSKIRRLSCNFGLFFRKSQIAKTDSWYKKRHFRGISDAP